MNILTPLLTLVFLLLIGCATSEKQITGSTKNEISQLPFIEGKRQYLQSPFVAAGDRVYLIGNQDGSFPDIGWHVDGEMGGIWDHPIKLFDGFAASIALKNSTDFFCLDKGDKFVNYPLANLHHFSWDKENFEVERLQFIPDGLEGAIVEFRISNHSQEKKEIVFQFTGLTDLRPTWLGDRTNMVDSDDEIFFDEKQSAIVAKDKNNPWYAMFGSSLPADFSEKSHGCSPTSRKGLGNDATLSYTLVVEANGEVIVPVFMAGSYSSEAMVRSTFETLKTQGKEKLAQKIERYEKIRGNAKLTIPDKDVEQMYEWLKYNTDWLVRNVPEQGVGLSAGLPDYPWWFGADATYALQGALATGDHELAKQTILLLHRISQRTNDNGRVIHEVSTNGSVYNPGNINETAQFITLILTYYTWTGDKELVTELYPDIRKGIDWLLGERDPDGNHYPNGSGMMEIPGLESDLEMIDVAVYTQQALASAAVLATAVGEQMNAAEYQRLANELSAKINIDWWQPDENSFGDFRGTIAEANPVLEAALIRSDTLGKAWSVTELKSIQNKMKLYAAGKPIPHVIYHNWVVNTPLETGIADADKGRAALDKAKTYENPFGVFVTGIDRTEEPDSVVLKSRKKTFSYTGAVMTLPTGVQAVAAARYGNPDEALQYIKKLHRSFSYALPGSMYEVSPDFGMMTQAWNIYGVAVPIVNHFFGIHPMAYNNSVLLSPNLPVEWKEAALENVKVGANVISFSILQATNHKEYRIQQSLGDWTVRINVKNAKRVLANDSEVDITTLKDDILELNGESIRIVIY